MLKLYKNIDGKLYYWETWDIDAKTAIIHSGIVGDKGISKKAKNGLFSNMIDKVKKEQKLKIDDGYAEIENEDMYRLIIEYKIEGMGTTNHVDKRTALQDKTDGVLGWTGLGYCDGGSTGGNTMEVVCFVVDFDNAKKVIEEELKNTQFVDYSRIYDEDK